MVLRKLVMQSTWYSESGEMVCIRATQLGRDRTLISPLDALSARFMKRHGPVASTFIEQSEMNSATYSCWTVALRRPLNAINT